MKIALIYDKYREDTLGEHYKRALAALNQEVAHFWLKDSSGIEPVFDAYLRIDDGDYKYDIPHDKLKPSFFYASDTHLKKPFKAIKEAARYYDHVFCAQYKGYRGLSRAYKGKISWLPHACDPRLHRKIDSAKRLDVAFVGNDGGSPRKFILQAIRERYPGSYIGKAHYTRISEIYSIAKIGFNYSIADDINMRAFEIMACGAMLITNRIKGNGFRELFSDRKNMASYKTPEEIFRLIDYYLRNDAERERISAAGLKLSAGHTYDKRASEMIETMEKHRRAPV